MQLPRRVYHAPKQSLSEWTKPLPAAFDIGNEPGDRPASGEAADLVQVPLERCSCCSRMSPDQTALSLCPPLALQSSGHRCEVSKRLVEFPPCGAQATRVEIRRCASEICRCRNRIQGLRAHVRAGRPGLVLSVPLLFSCRCGVKGRLGIEYISRHPHILSRQIRSPSL